MEEEGCERVFVATIFLVKVGGTIVLAQQPQANDTSVKILSIAVSCGVVIGVI